MRASLTPALRTACAALFSCLACAAPAAADAPAVSGINTKLSAFGGAVGNAALDENLAGVASSLTLPVFRHFGLQLDSAYARVGDADFGSFGAHFFWRNPSVGLVGFYAGHAWIDHTSKFEISRAGLEVQRYADRLTLDGAIGRRSGDAGDDIYGRARLDYYVTDNFMLSGGFLYEFRGFASLGAEYQIAARQGRGISLFAEGLIGEDNAYSVLTGVRLYLGEDMSLIDRHRRQDPPGYAGQDLQFLQFGLQPKFVCGGMGWGC